MRNTNMKKLIVFIFVAFFLSGLLTAGPAGSNTKIGLNIDDFDAIDVRVYKSDESANVGAETDVIRLEHSEANSDWRANYWLRIQVTTSHKVKITIGTDGPLAYDRGDSSADTIDVNITQMYGYWETSGAVLPVSNLWVSKAGDYTDKDYYEIGTDGVLTVNDASMCWGYVQVPDSYITGKKIENYSTNIVVKATII